MNPDYGFLESAYFGFDGSRRRPQDDFTRVVLHHTASARPAPSRKEAIEARLRDLEAELAVLARYGSDDYAEGDVLTFKGDFGNEGGTKYAYAAIKAGGKWHLTGGAKTPSYIGWDALVQFFIKANVQKVRKVVETERVV